jgi:hypothetical protein
MDGNRFDQLSKALGAVRSRRTVMALVLALESGGLLALLGGQSARAKTCKPKCPECKKCKKGTCKKKKGGRCGDVGTCVKGKCACTTEACPRCKTCDAGACVNDNGADCGLNASCQGGVCHCEGTTFACASETCCPQGKTCPDDGGSCIDCPPGGTVCTGPEGFCGSVTFEGDEIACGCFTSVSGKTTCSPPLFDDACAPCTSDADCVDRLGEGVPAVCVAAPCLSGQGPCSPGTTTTCMLDGCSIPEESSSARRLKLAKQARFKRRKTLD